MVFSIFKNQYKMWKKQISKNYFGSNNIRYINSLGNSNGISNKMVVGE